MNAQNIMSEISGLFAGLSKEQKQMLALAVVFAFLLIFVYFNVLLKPQIAGLISTSARVNKIKADLKSAQADIARMGQIRKSIETYSEKMGRYGDLLPTEEGMPALLESLSDMARASSMKIVSIVPVEDKALRQGRGQAYQAIPIAINAKAGFHELGKFFSALENSGRFMKVADVSVKSNRASPKKHDIELLVVTYTLPEGK